MNLKIRKTAFIAGACLAFLFGNAPQVWATSLRAVESTQQTKKITGTIVDQTGEPIIGANVLEKGTTNGTITDFDGNFSLDVAPGATLVVSFIGYTAQEISIGNQNNINVTLLEDTETLEEVVVVGYGVQKKKLVTGATVQVKGDDLQKLSTTSPLTALQSKTPGVNITQTSGQAGDGFKVNIRGLGTIGNSDPLYVIDGVAGGNLNSLNPSDIESIDVLKDAASAAIYGARAANGVILVTTKQGKSGKVQFSYDGYVGWQYNYKKVDALNAREYMNAMDKIRFSEGNSPFDWANLLPADLYASVMDGSWTGTDWFAESYKKGAPTQNHAINLAGGSETSKFSMGFSYTGQDGIFGGPVSSQYERYTARVNSDHILLKNDKFDVIKIGQTLNFSYSNTSGIAQGTMYWNSIHDMIIANPLLPSKTADGQWYDQDAKDANGWKFDGAAGNPIASSALSGRGLKLSKNWNLQASAFVEIQPMKNLIFKSQFGYKYSSNTYREMSKKRHLTTQENETVETVNQNGGMGHQWTLDNTLAYKFEVDQHNVDVMIGQSAEKWGMGEDFSGMGKNTLFEGSWDHAYLGNTKPATINDLSVGGSPWGEGSLASFFGRANYNYKETYMASFTIRADGSSNFARGNRWGYFPSASVGWVVTNEKWMEKTSNWMDFFKLRASWGQNGNCNISGFQYLTTYAFDVANGYYFGTDKSTQTTGGYANILANPDVTWETSEQLDLGFDARFLNSRLNVAFDWYTKKTKDWLVQAPILSTYGLNAPYVNGGDVENKGFEIALGWNDQINDFHYGANLNIAHNKNTVTRIANSEGLIRGANNVFMQGTNEIYRAQEGYPIGYFYGYKTEGIFQNQAQIDAYAQAGAGSGKAALSGAQPGDVIFVDYNKDGKIDQNDKTMIGNPHPDYTLGFSLNFQYKGLDFAATATGAFGQQIVRSYRNGNSAYENYTTDIFNCWNGEGTSNKLPRLSSASHTNWQNFSEIYVENGDYVKMQNLTIGYDFKQLWKNMPLQQLRLYFTAQNLFTITGYKGMDPEIGSNGSDGYEWASGIDVGFYPSPRTYLVGVNIKF